MNISRKRFREDRDIDDIRLGLTLLRNLVCIKDPPRHTRVTSGETEMLSTLQEQLIVRCREQHLLELVVSLTSSMDEKHNAEWNLLTLEIIFHVLFGRNVNTIADAGRKVGALAQIYQLEKREKARDQIPSTRQSKYAGVYNLITANGNNQTIVTHESVDASLIDLIERKKKVKGRIGQKKSRSVRVFLSLLLQVSPRLTNAISLDDTKRTPLMWLYNISVRTLRTR